METKRDLVKIGQEAFELLDKFYPPNRRSSQTYFHQYQSQNPNMVIHQINPSSKVATIEKMTIIRTHEIGNKRLPEAEATVAMPNHREIRTSGWAPVVVPRSQYPVLNNNVYTKKPAAYATNQDKADKKSRGGLFLIGGFGRK